MDTFGNVLISEVYPFQGNFVSNWDLRQCPDFVLIRGVPLYMYMY